MTQEQNKFSTDSWLTPDLGQARRHLELLGYGPNETVYIREFAGKGLTSTPKKYETSLNNLPKRQSSDRGVYFVVNGQGQKKKDIAFGRAIFVEFDDEQPLEEHLKNLSNSGLPEPTCILQSRRGPHIYWVFSDEDWGRVPIKFWSDLLEDAIALLGSDPACKDASRVMRLAGYFHVQAGKEPLQCKLIAESGQRYSFWELRQAIPTRAKNEHTDGKSQTPPAKPVA